MARNVEIKARLRSLDDARQIARQLGATGPQVLHQVDTYFRCQSGRLKLREIDDGTVQLIGYHRPDDTHPAVSHYQLCPLDNAEPLKTALRNTLGVRLSVDKQREVYFWKNVRIHLDEVHGLGSFLEFEDVQEDDSACGDQVVRQLMERFELSPDQLIAESYVDLLAAQIH